MFCVVAYLSYGSFDNIFFDKIGAKLQYHKIYKLIAFFVALNKYDAGLTLAFISGQICFGYDSLANVSFNTIYIILIFFYIYLADLFVQDENKEGLIAAISIRTLLYGYDIYGLVFLLRSSNSFISLLSSQIILIINVVLIGVCNVLEILMCYRSISQFNKGFKEMKSNLIEPNRESTLSNEIENK